SSELEGGRTLAEAFADVGAGCFLAHREHVVFAQNTLDVVEARPRRSGLHANPFRLLEALGLNDFDGQTGGLVGRLLLGGGVVRGGTHRGLARGGLRLDCGHTLPGYGAVPGILTRWPRGLIMPPQPGQRSKCAVSRRARCSPASPTLHATPQLRKSSVARPS